MGRTKGQSNVNKVGFQGPSHFCMAHWCYMSPIGHFIHPALGLFLFLCVGHFLSVMRHLLSRDWDYVCPLEFPVLGMALDLEVMLHNASQ